MYTCLEQNRTAMAQSGSMFEHMLAHSRNINKGGVSLKEGITNSVGTYRKHSSDSEYHWHHQWEIREPTVLQVHTRAQQSYTTNQKQKNK